MLRDNDLEFDIDDAEFEDDDHLPDDDDSEGEDDDIEDDDIEDDEEDKDFEDEDTEEETFSKKSKSIPYSRFKKVNERSKQLETEINVLKAQINNLSSGNKNSGSGANNELTQLMNEFKINGIDPDKLARFIQAVTGNNVTQEYAARKMVDDYIVQAGLKPDDDIRHTFLRLSDNEKALKKYISDQKDLQKIRDGKFKDVKGIKSANARSSKESLGVGNRELSTKLAGKSFIRDFAKNNNISVDEAVKLSIRNGVYKSLI